ncbi:MAG: SGNH/GDSL hydrolase family protein [Xanthobacteraceae bacterium]|nr:SGNH/GDSL hydrolase family protein [Xanthobacteraceae bacterium]
MRLTLAAATIMGLLLAVPAHSEEAASCAVADYLLTTEFALPKVAAAYNAKQPISILVVGSKSSSLGGVDGPSSSYPARLEAALRAQLPGQTISVVMDVRAKETAADVAPLFERIVADHKPTLVIWQTGTVDALRSVDPDDFRAALDEGIAALQKAGPDVILVNLQYSPRVETMLSASPYNDTMRVVAQEHGVPLFDRFAIMRAWSESGAFDLFAATHGLTMAKRVHDCIGRALAKLVVNAAHLDTPPVPTGMR